MNFQLRLGLEDWAAQVFLEKIIVSLEPFQNDLLKIRLVVPRWHIARKFWLAEIVKNGADVPVLELN